MFYPYLANSCYAFSFRVRLQCDWVASIQCTKKLLSLVSIKLILLSSRPENYGWYLDMSLFYSYWLLWLFLCLIFNLIIWVLCHFETDLFDVFELGEFLDSKTSPSKFIVSDTVLQKNDKEKMSFLHLAILGFRLRSHRHRRKPGIKFVTRCSPSIAVDFTGVANDLYV